MAAEKKFSYRKTGLRILILTLPLNLWLTVELLVLVSPVPARVLESGFSDSWRIYASRGELLREAVNLDGARARWTELDKMAPALVAATIAVEDERFYTHHGVDWMATGRALLQNLAAGESVSGASTITMQLARLIYHHPHSLPGKIGQVINARRLEHSFTKEQILLNYLNRSPYGAGAVGAEAASYRFFGKPAGHLSLAEAALIAGLPNAPALYNPLTHPEPAVKRQQYVLSRMRDTGVISADEYARAAAEHLVFVDDTAAPEAMHFTDYVLSLSPQPGDVRTTLDLDLNRQIEALVKSHVQTLSAGGMTNAAVVVLENRTGAILAMVGSADYWDGKEGAVNGAVALRQPGSCLKPFTYALAFTHGYTPATVIPDIETTYTGFDGYLYTPQNYSQKFHGPVLLAEALGRSLNVPAIRLANALGVERLLSTLLDAGFASLKQRADYYGLGLTLGNGEVMLLELAAAYALFARNGETCRAAALQKEAGAFKGKQLFTKEVCFLITDILSNEELRIQAFGLANPLLLEFPMAIKTGTSSNWRDNWVIGYTADFTLAVWAGDFSGNPMNQVSGAIGAGPLFHAVANLVQQHRAYPVPVHTLEPVPGVARITVCKLSGETPTAYCTEYASWYVPKTEDRLPDCSVHRKVLLDSRNGLLAVPGCPSRYTEEKVLIYLPAEYAAWQAENGIIPPPVSYSPLCAPGRMIADALVITCPRQKDIYVIEPGYNPATQTLELKGEVDPPVSRVEWVLDNKVVAEAGWPYTASWQLQKGRHTLYMQSGARRSDPVVFEVR